MAIAVYWAPTSMNSKKYNDAVRRLDKAGRTHPKGRLYHACFGSGNKLQVFEIWKSKAAFNAFGKTLMPILSQARLDPGAPMTARVRKVIAP